MNTSKIGTTTTALRCLDNNHSDSAIRGVFEGVAKVAAGAATRGLLEQPTMNVGILGSVGNGKSTLVKALTGKATQAHSKEKDTGRTVLLGYANLCIWGCEDTGCDERYWSCGDSSVEAPPCETHGKRIPLSHVSLVDCPGHHALMSTAVAGAAVMDAAILCVERVESQTTKHVILGECCGIRNWIVCQTKADIIPPPEVAAARQAARAAQVAILGIGFTSRRKQSALWALPKELFRCIASLVTARPDEETVSAWGALCVPGYSEIRQLVVGTSLENAPIIPISAVRKINLQPLLHAICRLPKPARAKNDFRMSVVRSFDVNRPGIDVDELVGGVVGGTVLAGSVRVGETVSLFPGLNGPLHARVVSIKSEQTALDYASPGGLVAVGMTIDPALAAKNNLVGQMVVRGGSAPTIASGDLRLALKMLKGHKVAAGQELRLSRLSRTVLARVTALEKRVASVQLYEELPLENASVSVSISANSKGFELIGIGSFVDLQEELPTFDAATAQKKKKNKEKDPPKKKSMEHREAETAFDASVVPSYVELVRRALLVRRGLNIKQDKVINLPAPQLMRNAKRLLWCNFAATCTKLGRPQQHVLAFLEKELFLKGSIDGEARLVLKGTLGRFQPEKIEHALVAYVQSFVRCEKCGCHTTTMERKKNNRYSILCQVCMFFRNVSMD